MRLKGLFARAASRILRVEVEGMSMHPTLSPGERLLVHRTRRVRMGDVVVITDPELATRTLVKRVSAIADHAVSVSGDNPLGSRDSTDFGPVPKELIIGRAWYRYFPPDVRKRLRRH